ncbi:cytochrome c [soil metagenome]
MNKIIFIIILFCFYIGFSAWVYTSGTELTNTIVPEHALKGKIIWQEKNCISCHQIYGLGGYLGPDLTHAISDEKRGKNYVTALITSGGNRMPDFKFNTEEVNALVEYLSFVDTISVK